MAGTEIHALTLSELAALLKAREVSPVEVTQATLARIEQLEPELHAFATVLPEAALESARRAEEQIGRGEHRGTLHGVPVAVKDLCAIKGVRTASGTRVMFDRQPDHTATVVERLEFAGAVILGKTQLTEGAYGWHHPDVTPPVNPWGAEYWTGVSSSGSGVATAAGLCFGSLGSDTGGSIRFPSACCGLVGIKPTYGRVTRYGVFPLAHSLDHIGPMTRSVADAAAMLGALAGRDPKDPTSLRDPVPDYEAELVGGVRGVRLGIDREFCTRGVAPLVSEVVLSALQRFEELGLKTREVEVPSTRALMDGWVSVTAVECAMAHADTFPSRADEYGPELRALIELAPRVSGADYARMEIERAVFKRGLEDLFDTIDLLLLPSLPSLPPLATRAISGNPAQGDGAGNLLQFTAPFDFSGSPTLSLPGGFTQNGIPLGFQLVGRHLDEALLCRAGHAYQGITDWHERRPPVS